MLLGMFTCDDILSAELTKLANISTCCCFCRYISFDLLPHDFPRLACVCRYSVVYFYGFIFYTPCLVSLGFGWDVGLHHGSDPDYFSSDFVIFSTSYFALGAKLGVPSLDCSYLLFFLFFFFFHFSFLCLCLSIEMHIYCFAGNLV